MSWQDRPYAGEDPQPELRIQFRRPSTAVTWLIGANIAVFLVEAVSVNWSQTFFVETFGLSLNGIRRFCFWQPLTYMFLHSTNDVFHLLFNMVGLYIFGCEFERTFGRSRFLQFYATCGLMGGLAYLTLPVFDAWMQGAPVTMTQYSRVPLVGASGAVYGLMIAAIIFFPHIQVVLVIFPVPIRVFGLIMAAIVLFQVILPGPMANRGGEICHLGGAVTAIGVLYAWGIMPRVRVGGRGGVTVLPGSDDVSTRRAAGAWERKQRQIAEENAEVDRILAKIRHEGIQSLTRKEKKALANATRRQQEEESRAGRIDQI